MITVKWFGHSMWKIRNEEISIITDPFEDIGYKVPAGERADIVLSSHDHFDHNNTAIIAGSPRIVNAPGKYDEDGVKILNLAVWHDEADGSERGRNLLMKFTLAGMDFLHCGDLGHMPDQSTFGRLGNVDVLFIPVGGFYTIDSETAYRIVQKLSPLVTFPMHYKTAVLDFPISGIDPYLALAGDHEKIDSNQVKLDKYLTGTNTTIILNYE